jgi:hypothetical protein
VLAFKLLSEELPFKAKTDEVKEALIRKGFNPELSF